MIDLAQWAGLPVTEAIPALRAALAGAGQAVLVAPPGAGKTTLVPLALLDEPWAAGGRILMLEPRRIAARAAAARMAAMLGEPVGETVGYRVRLDSRVGPDTRIEVLTEGLLTRRLQSDPSLEGVAGILFDEFHERSLQADLGLALTLEARAALRPELRLVVMSATVDAAPVAALLGEAPVVTSLGRAFPVETRYRAMPAGTRVDAAVASAVRAALAEESGSILAFLPGEGEIRRAEDSLRDGLPPNVTVAPLYGAMPPEAQDAAIRPAPAGKRKVVLATAVAETSLTIEGVRVVIDGGQRRVSRFDPATGMSGLETVRVSQAAAEQRRGRAGRLEPGVCIRLWSEPEQRALLPFDAPEMREADLAPLVLDLAQWGASDPGHLAWLDPPPAAAFTAARALLRQLGALDPDGRITPHGKQVARLGMHPRLAHMVLAAREQGAGRLACDIAGLLGERDIVSGIRDADLGLRLDLMRGAERVPPGASLRRGALSAAKASSRDWARRLDLPPDRGGASPGIVLARAFPDRIAQRRPGAGGQFRMANGRGAALPDGDPLAAADWLAIGALDSRGADARIHLAAPLVRAEIEAEFAELIAEERIVAWNGREGIVSAVHRRRLDTLVLEERPWRDVPADRIAAALLEGIREMGLAALPWSPTALRLRARIAFLRRERPEDGWPDWSDAALVDTLADWLGPHLDGMSRAAHLERLDLAAILLDGLDWPQRQALDSQAPTHVVVPSGSRLPVDYDSGAVPVLAVRVQEMFGAAATPTVAGGRVPLLLHLLSPAHRPAAITSDLAGFWASGWKAVRADLRGRYPKHFWPEDPANAPATARVRPRT